MIVNSWNRNTIPWWLLLPQGVSGAIKRRGGTAPFNEVRRHGAIGLGGEFDPETFSVDEVNKELG
jgi:O-acetyl-ADP-ribose deacetylase